MKLILSLKNASRCEDIPDQDTAHQWVTTALSMAANCQYTTAELSVRLVDTRESATLNEQYRQKSGATNVLSFPADIPAEIQAELPCPLLGDLVICAPLVREEAQQQNKSPLAHWAHLLVHGSLHLVGYDHIDDRDASDMEQLETQILAECGFSDPYQTNEINETKERITHHD